MNGTKTLHSTGGWELLWWVILVALAGALLLFATTDMAGATTPTTETPQLVPPWQTPMMEAIETFRTGETRLAAEQFEALACQATAYDMAGELNQAGLPMWTTVVAHANGDLETAVTGWTRTRLTAEAEVYRYVALADVYLRQGRNELAGEMLEAAAYVDGDHPLVHYYTGMFNLQVAEDVPDWFDAGTRSVVHFAAYPPRWPATPDTRAMALLIATREFEHALATAPKMDRQQPLTPWGWAGDVELLPTTGDLLRAMGADNFVPGTHHTLATLYLDRGLLEEAEAHLRDAVLLGQEVPYTYGELARQYEQQGRYLDAARGYTQQLRVGVKDVRTTQRLWENMKRAVMTDLLR